MQRRGQPPGLSPRNNKMVMRARLLLFLFALAASFSTVRADAPPDKIAWRPWSDAAFADAKREHKFVLLDLEAVWCHWCHVMDKETYSDPKVIALVNARYIAVRVDQDARPDLANRYQNYGWPATVVFAADRSEIVKRQGYLPPREMSSMLQAIIADPSPGPSVTNAPGRAKTAPADPQQLQHAIFTDYDAKLGGWSTEHKFLDWDNTEYLIARGLDGDARAEAMARQMLTADLKLIDPVWGGIDQYSIGDWDHPHFEKLIQMQAENMRILALAYAAYHDPAYLAAARKIHDYVRAFLTSPDGTVYTSQDADVVDGQAPEPYYKLDDAGRRKQGVPRVDRHVYARENGWWIEALCQLAAVTHDARYRDEAVRDATWIVAHRAAPGGGFHHGAKGGRQFYLGDTLFMGRAFLVLAEVTADASWSARSEQAAAFIRGHFAVLQGNGFITATKGDADFKSQPDFDENVALARWANLLAHESESAADRLMAASALGDARANASSQYAYVGGYLLARSEAQGDPMHVVVLGARSDATARGLFLTAIAAPLYYKQIESLDPDDKAQAAALKNYPHPGKPAAFLCANQTCSAPVFTPAALVKLLRRVKVP
jgi:uncharacterized protein YyaL (SSP411 family)